MGSVNYRDVRRPKRVIQNYLVTDLGIRTLEDILRGRGSGYRGPVDGHRGIDILEGGSMHGRCTKL